ncbi:MAG TPA: hypothetical protein VGQ76_17795 [Thermoanaerobaculia bacterium]|jgi:hypothetical protein|nr:hypothetical protein [Thermoanaerobaculia bacterium]
MKTLAVSFTLLLALAACQSPQTGTTAAPGHGAVTIEIIPNPIVATLVSGTTYDFPFEVVVRETGGRPTTVERVTARVTLGGGFTLAEESWDAARIRSMGYNTTVSPNSEVRYRFNPRQEVPDDRLFGSVSAVLKVDARDDTGTATSATTTVTVAR